MVHVDYLSPEKIQEAGTTWDELEAIQKDFERKTPGYEQAAQAITAVLLKAHSVHSGRYRVKDSIHLMEKIVRKRIENKKRVITIDNYEQQLTDLAGVRVLHLFKGDWKRIHKFITTTWKLHEKPTAYYREGDPKEIRQLFVEQGCKAKQHPAGYRSVHYIVETSPTKIKRYAEIQVRTIFEEGWSEIDHKVRYPNFSNNPLTNELLMMLNRLAGSADEMSSFVQVLDLHLKNTKSQQEALRRERDDLTMKLDQAINNSTISAKDKSELQEITKSINDFNIKTSLPIGLGVFDSPSFKATLAAFAALPTPASSMMPSFGSEISSAIGDAANSTIRKIDQMVSENFSNELSAGDS